MLYVPQMPENKMIAYFIYQISSNFVTTSTKTIQIILEKFLEKFPEILQCLLCTYKSDPCPRKRLSGNDYSKEISGMTLYLLTKVLTERLRK